MCEKFCERFVKIFCGINVPKIVAKLASRDYLELAVLWWNCVSVAALQASKRESTNLYKKSVRSFAMKTTRFHQER
jgi:hypothetical protein